LPTLPKVDAVITDPPYGIGDKWDKAGGFASCGGRLWTGNDGWDRKAPEKSLIDAIVQLGEISILWGGNYFADLLPATRGWIYWNKGQDGLTMSDGELAWTTENKPLRAVTVNRNALRDSVHPTQKPVEVIAFAIKYLDCDGVVLDLFGGSGSTLIAAQETNRVAYLMELDPHYVDVICARFQKLTGVLPVLESSGKVHDFLNA
jgi:DNA modification methylase